MLQPELQRGDQLTKRQREVLERLEQGIGVRQIATDLGISRAAVYQHIDRLRRQGAVAETFTASGRPPRARTIVGGATLAHAARAPRESGLATLRAQAAAGSEGGGEYAEAVEEAIAGGDAIALAYELGRLDARGEHGLAPDLIESALRRLGVLPAVGE